MYVYICVLMYVLMYVYACICMYVCMYNQNPKVLNLVIYITSTIEISRPNLTPCHYIYVLCMYTDYYSSANYTLTFVKEGKNILFL